MSGLDHIPAAVFLPPTPEVLPDPALWIPSDKHLVLDFLSPASPRALALVQSADLELTTA